VFIINHIDIALLISGAFSVYAIYLIHV